MGNKTISVFEYETLLVDGLFLTQEHFKALVKFNDLHGGKYFRIGYNKVTFNSYVGVIQVGNRTIEILPKADVSGKDVASAKNKWQAALLSMLKKVGYLKINSTDKAAQDSTRHNLLELYLFSFLQEVQKVIHVGFVKKYRKVSSNSKVLKGRMLMSKQIQHNIIHQERFYTENTIYDGNHLLNNIIKKALKIVICTTSNQHLKMEFSKFILHFQDIEVWNGAIADLDGIVLNRKSSRYQDVLELSKLIIKSFSPDLSAGKENIISILFNMNTLFEKFVLKCLKDFTNDFSEYSLSITGQERMIFWKDRVIKPDIVLTYKEKGQEEKKVVIDAKWKVIEEDNPSINDLRQMYTYNLQFGASKALLFYPRTNQNNKGVINYAPMGHEFDLEHGCGLYFAELFEEGVISNKFAYRLIKEHFNLKI